MQSLLPHYYGLFDSCICKLIFVIKDKENKENKEEHRLVPNIFVLKNVKNTKNTKFNKQIVLF